MKNILVPIDFSQASFNALSYAASLANVFNCKITVLHVYSGNSLFDAAPEPGLFDSIANLEATNEKFLKKQLKKMAEKFTVKIKSIVQKGKPAEVIEGVALKLKPDVIIMGMKGKGESNSVFGSTTTKMIARSSIPLFVIPMGASFQTFETITLATDLKNDGFLNSFHLLEEIIIRMDPFIQLLNVQKRNSKLSAELIASKERTALIWDKYDNSFNIIERDEVEEGIARFLKKHKTDLLVMVARRRNLITQIFAPSHTRRMTYQTKIPLLILKSTI